MHSHMQLISLLGLLSLSRCRGSYDVLRSIEPFGPQTAQPFGVEVKGPASQYLHRQALAYLHSDAGPIPSDASNDYKPVLPPSKPHSEHATVLEVSIYTLLMAAASVRKFENTRK